MGSEIFFKQLIFYEKTNDSTHCAPRCRRLERRIEATPLPDSG
jgi:hypothetical protein